MTVAPEAQIPQPEKSEASAEDQALLTGVLLEALPMLFETRDASRIVEFCVSEASGLPTEKVTIEPYYMNKADPKQLGIWKLRQDGRHSLYIYSSPGPETAEMRLSDRLSLKPAKAPPLTDVQRVKEITGLLRVANEAYARHEPEVRPKSLSAKKRRLLGRLTHPVNG